MANIKKNEKTGKWEVRLSLGFNEEGKRVQRYFSDERKKTVEYWVADQIRAQKEGEFIKVRPKGRVGEVLDDWLEFYIKTTMVKTTYHSYTSFVENVPGWYKCQPLYVQFCSFNNVQYCRFRQTRFVPSDGPSIDMSPRISARRSNGEGSGPRWRLPVSGLRTLPPTNRN